MQHPEEEEFWIEPQPLPPNVQQVVDAMGPSPADPLGSWTGVPLNGGEPVRDVDDF